MAEEEVRRRSPIVNIIRRAVGRPYLLMAAVMLIVGAIWFSRLALQEFLLLDRLVNVYTNDAIVKMETFAVKPSVTAEVLEVLVTEGDAVEKDQELVRLRQDDLRAELHRTEAAAESMQQQIQEMRLAHPLAVTQARQEVGRAEAMLEIKQGAVGRAQVLLTVQRDRVEKMLGEQQANLQGARARLREQEAAVRESEMGLERTRSLFQDGIVAQERLDAAQTSLERAQARLTAAQEQVRQVQLHYPSGDSPQMLQVHEKDAQRVTSEVKEQRAAVELSRTNLRLVEARAQSIKILEAQYQEAQARVEAAQLKLAKTVIRSPGAGIVGYRNVEAGEIVEGDPSNPPILIIHNPRKMWIVANVWESDISRVRIGLTAEIWIDAFRTSALGRGRPFPGRVRGINPTTWSETSALPPERFFTRREQKVSVKVRFDDAPPGFRAGMLAEVLILVDDGAVAREQ